MTSGYNHRTAFIECDVCGDYVESTDGIAALWSEAKSDNWRARKFGDDWVHHCPKCGPIPEPKVDFKRLMGETE